MGALARALSAGVQPRWDAECLFDDGDAYFAALEFAIDTARLRVEIETYILGDDEVGGRVLAALARAVGRGVRVRLLVDGVGSATWLSARARSPATQGIELRVYHPTPWQACGSLLPTVPSLPRALAVLRVINNRDHRKLVVIDGATAFVGSFNLERRHSRTCCGAAAWRDAGVRVEGGAVAVLEQAFAATWSRAWRLGARRFLPAFAWRLPAVRLPTVAPVRLWQGVLHRRRLRHDLARRIATARTRVWLRTPYLVPSPAIVRALVAAARRGVAVEILVPERNDVWFMPWIASLLARQLALAGVRVLALPGGMLHAKTALIDDWAALGSLNLNGRSLYRDLELEVVVDAPATLAGLAARQREEAAAAWPLADHPLGLGRRLLARLLLVARWWI